MSGYTLRKKNPTIVMPKVPQASRARKALGSPGNKTLPHNEKKKAERPNAARGNAVAVPLFCGQFNALVLTAAAKDVQPPTPDMKEKAHNRGIEPEPAS